MVSFTEVGTEYLVSETPWPDLSSRNRAWYDPYMMAAYVKNSMWYNIVKYVVDMLNTHSRVINITRALSPLPDIQEQEARGITLPRIYYDSMSQQITVTNYGGERRLREINSSLRWSFDKMYDKLRQG